MAKNKRVDKDALNKKNKTEKKIVKTGDLFIEPIKNDSISEIDTLKESVMNFDNVLQSVQEPSSVFEEDKIIEKSISSLVKSSSESANNIVEDGFTLDKPIYLEIHKANLLQFVSSGVIYPNRYSNQKAFVDPQSINTSSLLISNNKISKENSEHVLLQISWTAFDPSLIITAESYAIYNGVIPFSRVLKIFVHNSEVKKRILDDSSLRDGGLLPENIIQIGLPEKLVLMTYANINANSVDWAKELQQYDKILGLIAGSRNFNLLTFQQTQLFKSISDHCLFAMQAIDSDFAKEVIAPGNVSEYYNWLFTESCPNDRILLKWLFERVYDSSNFTDVDTTEFEILCFKTNSFEGEEKQLERIFFLLKSSIERRKVFNEILKLQSKQSLALYVFAYLRNYATKQNPELARLDLAHLVFSKYTEYAFATLNFFFGYKQHRNSEDRVNNDHTQLIDIIKSSTKPFIKFELKTLFDYKVIDCVFNSVFNAKIKLKENDYSEYININNQSSTPLVKISGYNYFSTLIYGKRYQVLAKIDPQDSVLSLINKLPSDISIFSELGLYCYRIGLKMNPLSFSDLFVNQNALKYMFSYPKAGLIDAIRSNKIDIDEIKLRITLAQKYNEI